MACKVGTVIYCILQSIAFLFVLVGTPIDQFRAKGEDIWGNTACLTFWGMKNRCYSVKYDIRTRQLWAACPDRRDRFQAASAFGIISIAVFGLAALFGFIQLCCCRCLRWICLVLNILGIGASTVAWACMVSEYYTTRGVCAKLNIGSNFGAGFALFVTGFALNTINIIFLMLPC